ncbi:MAG: DGQHR domain-containing protein [Gammaproteobacteria bacterium WSBS_2016_MAG_OTU1]
MQFRKLAVEIKQGNRHLYLTFITVRDFMADNFYRIDKLDVENEKGFQRLLNDKRALSFGMDIIDAYKVNQEFLPTSVFLATSGTVGYDRESNEIFFDSSPNADVCPLDVVDGQHRIEGLRMAIDKEPALLDFPIAVTIASNLTAAEKMLQFVIVNTTQRPVESGVAQHIIARFTKMQGVKNLPPLPKWLNKEVEKGTDEKAIDIAKFLNSDEKSPWRGRIRFSDEDKKNTRHTIEQKTFVTLVKRGLLTHGHPLYLTTSDQNKRLKILINFWTAVENIFVANSTENDEYVNTVVFKSNGIVFFHRVFYTVLKHLANKQDYTVATIEKSILSAKSNLSPDIEGIMDPEFWRSGNSASKWNNSGVIMDAAKFVEAFNQSNETSTDDASM